VGDTAEASTKGAINWVRSGKRKLFPGGKKKKKVLKNKKKKERKLSSWPAVEETVMDTEFHLGGEEETKKLGSGEWRGRTCKPKKSKAGKEKWKNQKKSIWSS